MKPKLTIIIKALNEENNIERTIKSCIKETKNLSSEIILADSLSTDKTIDIAKKYPIKIIQLNNAKDRSCGIGPQIGYEHAKGELIYILDGDMEFEKGFLKKAIHELKTEEKLAGIAGQIKEMHVKNIVFARRSKSKIKLNYLNRLEMGGLYKKEALQSVGYFSNQNLHAYEEAELGLRLMQKGWKLKRINVPAIKHYGYQINSSFGVFKKRWRTRYIKGVGEYLRSSISKPYLKQVLYQLRIYVLLLFWWISLFVTLALLGITTIPIITLGCLTALFLLILLIKKRNIKDAIFSVISWHYSLIGLIWGFFTKQKNPNSKINSKVIK